MKLKTKPPILPHESYVTGLYWT